MANETVNDQTDKPTLDGTENLLIQESAGGAGSTKRATTQAVADLASGVDDADYLVGTAHAGLSAEIVVGTTPGGELGGTWASPTVDATHSGSSHASVQAAAEATAANADNLTSGTVNIARLPLDADLATLSLPASTTITAAAATVLDDASTAAMLTTLGAQPVDSDLTTIAGLTATTDNMIQSVGSAWASRTPAQVKAALAIAESDVTNLTTDLTALQTSTALQAAQIEARRIADLGYYAYSTAGLLLTPNATPTKLDMAAGTAFMGTTELNAAVQTAISTTIASMADATNPKWVSVELDSSKVVQFNQGTAAAAPAFPTITATRVPLGFLFIPANATNVDTLLTTNNGLAKLIDARNVRTVHPARRLTTDTTGTVATNPTTATSLLAATYDIPADSLSVGDTIIIEASGSLKLVTSNSTFTLQMAPVLEIPGSYTTASLTAHATQLHRWTARMVLTVKAIGASARYYFHFEFDVTDLIVSGQSGPSLDRAIATGLGGTFNSAAAQTVDLFGTIGTGNASSNVTLAQYNIQKIPA